MQWRRFVCRGGPWFGVLVTGIDALVNGVVVAAQPNFDPLRDYISELSASPIPYSGLIRGWWVAFPFLFAPFALSVYYHLPRSKVRWVPLALLLVFSLGVFSCGVFHCDPGCRGRTVSAQIHFISSYTGAAALYFSPLALAIAGWNDERWQDFLGINVGCLVFGAAAGIALFLAGDLRIVPDRGLCERLFFGVFYVWVVLVALRLLKLEHSAPFFNRAWQLGETGR